MRITICKRARRGGGWISRSRLFFRHIGMCRQLLRAFPTTHFPRLQLRMWQHSIAPLWFLGTESNRTTTRWQLKAFEDGSVVTGLYFAARVTFRREGTDYINLLLEPNYEHESSMTSETRQPPTGIRCPDRLYRSGSLYRLSYPSPIQCFIWRRMADTENTNTSLQTHVLQQKKGGGGPKINRIRAPYWTSYIKYMNTINLHVSKFRLRKPSKPTQVQT